MIKKNKNILFVKNFLMLTTFTSYGMASSFINEKSDRVLPTDLTIQATADHGGIAIGYTDKIEKIEADKFELNIKEEHHHEGSQYVKNKYKDFIEGLVCT